MADAGYPELGRVAVAIVHDDPPSVFMAQNEHVLARVLALQLVANTSPSELEKSGRVEEIREALLQERWADAMFAWMDVTDTVVDVYPDDWVWTDEHLDLESASFEIRMAPIFAD